MVKRQLSLTSTVFFFQKNLLLSVYCTPNIFLINITSFNSHHVPARKVSLYLPYRWEKKEARPQEKDGDGNTSLDFGSARERQPRSPLEGEVRRKTCNKEGCLGIWVETGHIPSITLSKEKKKGKETGHPTSYCALPSGKEGLLTGKSWHVRAWGARSVSVLWACRPSCPLGFDDPGSWDLTLHQEDSRGFFLETLANLRRKSEAMNMGLSLTQHPSLSSRERSLRPTGSAQRLRTPRRVQVSKQTWADNQGFSDMWERPLTGWTESKTNEHKNTTSGKLSERCKVQQPKKKFFLIGCRESNIQSAKISFRGKKHSMNGKIQRRFRR